jgi:hypothetical protein
VDLDATLTNFVSSFDTALHETVNTYLSGFEKVAGSIVALLISIELIKVAINFASGNGTAWADFIKKMLVYLVVLLCIINFSDIYNGVIGINKTVLDHNDTIEKEYVKKNAEAMSEFLANKFAYEQQQKDLGLFKRIKGMLNHLHVKIYFFVCDLLMAISFFLTKIFYVFYFTKISFFLLVGPIFLAFGTSSIISSMAKKWSVGVLVNILAIIFLSAAFKMIANLNVDMVKIMASNIGSISFGPWVLLIGKFMVTLGILLSVPKAAQSLRYSAA